MIYPLPLSNFWFEIGKSRASFGLPSAANLSRTHGGEITTALLGSRLWTINVTLAFENNDDAVAVQSTLRMLVNPGASFLASPILRRTPKSDVHGSVLGRTVTIGSLPAGSETLGLSGLQPGYIISKGDYVSWVVAGIYHIHQFGVSGQADASGVLAALDVVPPIRSDAATGQVVSLVDATMKAVIDPSTLNEGSFGSAITSGMTFTAIQTLRA
ncbi:MAG: hypothetical protein JKX71_12885 [Amylibacter sp.]|nr:hypothetical protein [Amylibacter sp.]